MAEKRVKWFKFGCLGGLAGMFLLVLIVAGLGITALMKVQSEQVKSQEMAYEIPRLVGPTRSSDSSSLHLPSSGPMPGRVSLDLSQGEFYIKPARRGEPLRVEATYDKKSYELQEHFEPRDGRTWIYWIHFRQTSFPMVTPLALLMGGHLPKVRIYLPLDVPMNLDIRLGTGHSEVELGGLWLTSTDIHFSKGHCELSLKKPLVFPMERLWICCAMGDFETSRVGNASPRTLEVDYSMGHMELDLRGKWVQDAEVTITGNMAAGEVRLPRDVNIEGLETRPSAIRDGSGARRPTLTFSVSNHLGDLIIDD